MKSEHRHELKTNELAQWLSDLPQWTKRNLKMIIYVSVVVVLVAGSYFYHSYRKNVVAVQKQIELTGLINQLTQNKVQILQSQAGGFDNSYMLIQTADDLQAAAEKAEDDQMAAFALIKKAEALRMELHYRLGTIDGRDVETAISRAKASYSEALQKASYNPSLRAMAAFGLGICEEEVGNFTGAEQIYRQMVTDPAFEGTTAVEQAKHRLSTIAEYQQRIVFMKMPKSMPAESVQPQIKLDAPESPQTQIEAPELSDANLSGQ